MIRNRESLNDPYRDRESRPRWFVLYAKHQHESSVATMLQGKGFEVFYPTYEAVHRWKDRSKKIRMSLFPGYVFFAEGLDRRVQILSTPGVHSIVSFGEAPAQIPHQEIAAIRRAAENSIRIEPHPFLREGNAVEVISGPLEGITGILQRKKDLYRLILSIQILGRSAAVEIDVSSVKPAPAPRDYSHLGAGRPQQFSYL
jgi:transcription antitermination factor NusG